MSILKRASHGEPELFFACAGEASKMSFARLLAVGSRRLVRRSRFAKRFSERLELLQRSCSFRGARAGAIFRGARALPNRPLVPFWQGSCRALAPPPAGAVPNVCFGKGSAWGAGQEPEPFFACAGETSKTSFAWLLDVGLCRLMRRSCFTKRFPERLQLLQRSCSFRGARAGAIFR